MPANADGTLAGYDGASLQVVKALLDEKSFEEGWDGATPLSGRSEDAWLVYFALTGLPLPTGFWTQRGALGYGIAPRWGLTGMGTEALKQRHGNLPRNADRTQTLKTFDKGFEETTIRPGRIGCNAQRVAGSIEKTPTKDQRMKKTVSVAMMPTIVWAVTIIGMLAAGAAEAGQTSVNSEPAPQGPSAAPPAGFTAIFNGKDLTGWYGLGHFDPRELWAMSPEERAKKREREMAEFQAHWRVENGELVNDGAGSYATTEKEFGDIEFLIDYKTVPKADSGIYLRATPQVQIWDYTEEGGKWSIGADKGSGGLWNNASGAPGKDPIVLADKPFGEWNHFRILQLGARTTVYLNDKLVVDNATMENYWDRSKPLFPRGPIQLQTHGGEIRWRNIFLREIPAEEANRLVRGKDDGFDSIFNGRDLEGWEGPVENYEVRDGSIVCKENKGGTIYTKEEFSDFVVRLEFKLPPGGNNGLAIRYPGSGDTAYVGMCELQVLDDTAPQYAKLDPRQSHGAAYGMAAAHRGYLRPTGEWNYQEVTVIGSTIKVGLNGVVILDTDLGKVTEYMANRPHPGKERASGHFGFAGHSDPVMFRNIAIKRLK